MTLNRKTLIPLTMVILILVGIGSSALITFAQDTSTGQDVAACDSQDTDNVQHEADGEADDASETQCAENGAETADSSACTVADTDNVQEEVQSDNETDNVNEAQCPEDSVEANDTVQDSSYTGSITVDDSTGYASEDDEIAALTPLATITPEQAQAAVEAQIGGTVVKVELDNENGVLVYSVELEDGSDVKVDAGNGSILHTDAAGADTNE